jgi:hypothetical protein
MTDLTSVALFVLIITALALFVTRALVRDAAARRRFQTKPLVCGSCGREAWGGTKLCPRCGAGMPLEYVEGNVAGGFEVLSAGELSQEPPLAKVVLPVDRQTIRDEKSAPM